MLGEGENVPESPVENNAPPPYQREDRLESNETPQNQTQLNSSNKQEIPQSQTHLNPSNNQENPQIQTLLIPPKVEEFPQNNQSLLIPPEIEENPKSQSQLRSPSNILGKPPQSQTLPVNPTNMEEQAYPNQPLKNPSKVEKLLANQSISNPPKVGEITTPIQPSLNSFRVEQIPLDHEPGSSSLNPSTRVVPQVEGEIVWQGGEGWFERPPLMPQTHGGQDISLAFESQVVDGMGRRILTRPHFPKVAGGVFTENGHYILSQGGVIEDRAHKRR